MFLMEKIEGNLQSSASPCYYLIAGEVDPSKTSVSIKSSTMVLKPTIAAFITLDECDKFGNKCESSEETLSQYIFSVTEVDITSCQPLLI